ncbi:MAG: hypothetical protein WBM35_10680, partial [Candidatus Electrothrix sp.]
LGEAYDRRLNDARARQEQFKETNPKAALVTQLAGNVATGLATGGIGSNLVAREAALGGLEGFGSGDSLEDRARSAGTGTAMGAGFSKLGDVIGSVFARPSSSQRVVEGISEVAARAEKKAGKRLLTKAQRLDSDMGRRIEAGLETLPVAGGATKNIKAGFQDELNSAAARSIGQDAEKLTPDVVQTAKEQISDMFNMAIKDKTIPVSNKMIDNLVNVIDNYTGVPGGNNSVKKIGEELFNELDAPITAERYQRLSSFFGKKIKTAAKAGDGETLQALWEIKDSLDDMVSDSLGPEVLGEFKDARAMYKNLMALTKNRHVINPATGDVSGKRLFGELSKQGNATNVGGELGDLARLSTVKGVGDSGTASRLIPGMAIGAGVMGGADISGGILGSIGASRVLDEVAQRGIPGVAPEGLGMLSGALSRTVNE